MRSLFLALALVFSGATNGAVVNSPEETLRAFYGLVLKSGGYLPTAKQRIELSKVLSKRVMSLLKEASETQAQCIRVTPKPNKPLLVETAIFFGNWETATQVAYGKLQRQGNQAVAEVNLSNSAENWTASVQLALDEKHWMIEDIQFRPGSEQQFSLTSDLTGFIALGKACFEKQSKRTGSQ